MESSTDAESSFCVVRRLPFVLWAASPEKGGFGVSDIKSEPRLERASYTVQEFCARHNISRPTYHRLRRLGLGPKEMRPAMNLIRITADADREWQRQMQKSRPDLEVKTAERAVKAGNAAAKSSKHISKIRKQRTRPEKQRT
jgi:hypothetical protein